jgi:4-amino-4-deoxy-L-arabinose transferase-like glycosyltransferase
VIKSEKFWFRLVLTVGLLIRLTDMYRPADHSTFSSWRESDYTQVARSFYREDMNPLHPRVDWRGNTSGLVEMELPVIPWLGAVVYSVAGYHEQVLRVLSTIFSCLGLFAFASLARRMMPGPGSIFAMAAFAVNGLLVGLSGAIQPESLQILFCVLAIVAAQRWTETDSTRSFYAACFMTAAAILAKSPSAYLGFVLAYEVLRRYRWQAFVNPRVYAGILIALALPATWYTWAHQHYLNTGLSLGVSNETHFLSWVMVLHPFSWMLGNVLAEVREVFSLPGLVFGAAAFFLPWKEIRTAAVWYASIVVFYVITADTSGDGWAVYYHSNSVAAASLLMGAGFSGLLSGRILSRLSRSFRPAAKIAILVVGGVVLTGLGARSYYYLRAKQGDPKTAEMYNCISSFRDSVPAGEKIVVRGGGKFDEHGHPVAFNESMAFTWMDRKGFNYGAEDFSLETLLQSAEAGATFWVSGPADRMSSGEWRRAEDRFALIADCGEYSLFRLRDLRDPSGNPEGTR